MRQSNTSSTRGQTAYPVGIRSGGSSGMKGGLPYFSSTILMDLLYSGLLNQAMAIREASCAPAVLPLIALALSALVRQDGMDGLQQLHCCKRFEHNRLDRRIDANTET